VEKRLDGRDTPGAPHLRILGEKPCNRCPVRKIARDKSLQSTARVVLDCAGRNISYTATVQSGLPCQIHVFADRERFVEPTYFLEQRPVNEHVASGEVGELRPQVQSSTDSA